MMRALASDDSKISFEGRLSQTDLARLEGVTDQENDVLKRATLQPRLDFLVLPLTQKNIPTITRAIASRIAFGSKGIIHVQIASRGKLAFAAYDNFDQDCTVAFSAVPLVLLDELVKAQVLRRYKRVPSTGG
jgi:hypothetical protein